MSAKDGRPRERPVVITGVGLVSPLGDSLGALQENLCRETSGLGPVEIFPVEGLPVTLGGEVKGFSPRDYLPEGNLRPLDRTAQLAASATQKALEDAGLSPEDRWQRCAGFVLGTVFGSVQTISAFDRRALEAGPQYAKPLDFANSVINAAAGQTAIWHGLPGTNSTICGGTASGLQAMIYGADLIRYGRAEVLVAGGAEELCFESFLGYQRTGRVAGSRNGAPPCAVPFSVDRNGFLLAEGAAFFVLESEDSARERGAEILAVLRGGGSTFDPSRGLDGGHAASSVERAVQQALDQAHRSADDLGAVSTSANGSLTGDLYEAEGLARALGERAESVPVTAPKGLLGESLGAGGALQAVALLAALQDGRLPGIGGPGAPAPGLPLRKVQRASQGIGSGTGLVSSLSFDGHCCAVVLETAKPERAGGATG